MLCGYEPKNVTILCHAGGIGRPRDIVAAPIVKPGLSDAYYERLKAGRGRVILASPRPDEFSCVLPGARYGLFTEYLLGGLRGCVASDDGLVRVLDLFEYLQPRVTRAHPRQHPIVKAELEENFAVALYRGGPQGFVPKVEGDCLACWFANHSLSEYACRGLELVRLRP